jgi:putative membrane protein
MPKPFDDTFRADIGRAIAQIESQSHSEWVVLVKQRTDSYAQYPLGLGAALAFLALSYFHFSAEFFDEWLIYVGTIGAFALSAALTAGLPGLLRLIVGRKRLRRNVEILARACFQKGGLHHTRDKTALLVFVAVFERQVALIPDRGVESAVPPAEWAKLRQGFDGVFRANNPAAELLARLEEAGPVFSRYVPQVEDDTNELPDNLDIDL